VEIGIAAVSFSPSADRDGPPCLPVADRFILWRARRTAASIIGTGWRLGKPSANKVISREVGMDYQRYVFWKDGDMWLGYLERYPDYWTQGETQEELRENLKDLYGDLTGGHIPCVREAAVLEIG
jgi:hypothetical protein